MSLVIQSADPSQSRLLSRLAQRSKAHWGYSAEFIQACKHELTYTAQSINKEITFVAWCDGEILGFYQLVGMNPLKGELEALFIEPQQIGSGVGKRLFTHAMNQAGQAGFKQVLIQSDPYAEMFYLKMGCVKVGEKPSLSIPGRVLPLLIFTV
ncbi:GNAT family N-acetyltransferase [Marinicella sp. S1101]|uniref:GNAT family N-acetyltransferase n=1 Tax=Marinicella marina TaxID=2996016 RepID=UPI002260D0A0|nr:GNAT family N-acetyltransferase [Marinicella marina]MCX7553341.1 GNAT family N-acetyltransferase [Marinicella marina]MDJ1139073.1 GNAT family N-acetyltransferase [Marinicella marina]